MEERSPGSPFHFTWHVDQLGYDLVEEPASALVDDDSVRIAELGEPGHAKARHFAGPLGRNIVACYFMRGYLKHQPLP